MTRRAIIHIGSPKCGSTYLQRVCLQNRGVFSAHGLAYPPVSGPHPGNGAELLSMTADGIAAAYAPGVHTLIYSHENLFWRGGNAAEVAGAFAGADVSVQVVAFLRPFSEFIFGDYSQFMKQNFAAYLDARMAYDGRGFEEFAVDRSRVINAAAWLSQWSEAFPENALILAPHRAVRQVMGDLTGLGDALDWEVQSDQTNPSLRTEDCDRIAALMSDPCVPADAIRDRFKAAFFDTKKPDRGRTVDRIRWVEALFARQNRTIAERFGYDNRPANLPAPVMAYLGAGDEAGR